MAAGSDMHERGSDAPGMSNSPLHSLVSRLARVSARHRRLVLAAWLLLVVGCSTVGALAGTRTLTDAQTGNGSSARGQQLMHAAGFRDPSTESVLVVGKDRVVLSGVASRLVAQLRGVHNVFDARGPADSASLLSADGHAALVELGLHGTPSDTVLGVQRAVAAAQRANPSVRLLETGEGTIGRAINDRVSSDLQHAELFALPLTLIILVLAFGAVIAASVPLLLGITSVAAAIGAVGILSHAVATSPQTFSSILLIGLAVGVDYSLFYMRREREERRAGRDREAALEASAATVGHAIVVSGLSVTAAMAGLLLTGNAVFTSLALGTMLVVAIAVLGSLTVLPAVLAMLGHRVEPGRVRRRRRQRRERRRAPGAPASAWRLLGEKVVARPGVALAGVVIVLGALAFQVTKLHTANPGIGDLGKGSSIAVAQRAIERAFPGSSHSVEIVVGAPAGESLGSTGAGGSLVALGQQAVDATGAHGAAHVATADHRRFAVIYAPLPGNGSDARTRQALATLRAHVLPAAARRFPRAQVELTGEPAGADDFNTQMRTHAPLVIGFVLALGFALLLLAFRSVAIAGAVLALNLLSVGAAYGVLVAVFQHHWAEGMLGFTSTGAVASWLPLFAFAVLFGLSMDYTVLVVSRVHEGMKRGLPAREAAVEGLAATAGVVTSAAVVMVAVFSVFATLGSLELKQMGVGLAAAILIDATLVRAVALPAAIALLGDRSWGRHAARPGRRAAREATEVA